MSYNRTSSNVGNADIVNSSAQVPDYIPADNDVEEDSPKPFSKKKIVFIGVGVLIGLTAVSNAIHDSLGTAPLSERVEALNLEGISQSDAEERLDRTLNNDETVAFSSEDIDEEEGDPELDYIVDDLFVAGDTVEVDLAYHSYDVISNMGIEGTSLPDAEEELEQAGFQREEDYNVYTDGPDMYIESNWSVINVRPSDGGRFTEIIVTNSAFENIGDTANDFVESVEESWGDYNNTLEQEREDRAQGREDISDLSIEGSQWSDAERVLYQNSWHSSDYIVRTDTGMPVFNPRNWDVVEVDENLEERPVIFLEK